MIAVLGLFACSLADIRPDVVDPLAKQAQRETQGRALLKQAALAHGVENWPTGSATHLVMRDHWRGIYRSFSPWPDSDQRIAITQYQQTFDSSVLMLDGRRQGWMWGINEGSAWTIDPGGNKAASDNKNITFMLPTVHYFVELPFRLPEAEIARFVNEQAIRGQVYDVVYATWHDAAANPEYDQYLIYISKETGRIDYVYYTVREAGNWVKGTVHLQEQQEVSGVWLPFVMSVTTRPTQDPDKYFHRMTIEELRFE